MVTWFRYVAHARISSFTAAGWIVCADLGPTHGAYAVLMQFTGTGEPHDLDA